MSGKIGFSKSEKEFDPWPKNISWWSTLEVLRTEKLYGAVDRMVVFLIDGEGLRWKDLAWDDGPIL